MGHAYLRMTSSQPSGCEAPYTCEPSRSTQLSARLAGEAASERETLTTAISPRLWLSCEKLISVSLAPLADDWNASRTTTVL